ncbi:MAG: hypothetical protein OQK52_07445 [Ignavibacteriaceae bacterium]|nr:hypothetical protein [Ignavibacteriaceae bacterium]MCW8961623.1 hypothetical protein [Ignavibacteriaceae bacterium]
MNTKFYFPKNIFSSILLSEMEKKSNVEFETVPSSVIAKRLAADQNSVGLIPSLDLISNKDLFVSSEIGISFDALLSNAYIHFKEEQETIDEIFLKGDVTSNEVILSKILFKEFYDVEVKTTLLSHQPTDFSENILIVGDENYEKEIFLSGLSFAEEIIELINAPYVNFVLAGTSDELVKKINSTFKKALESGHAEKIDHLFPTFPQTALDYVTVNLQHLVFDFDEQDLEGIKLLLQMPYYHGLIKDIIEVKFV